GDRRAKALLGFIDSAHDGWNQFIVDGPRSYSAARRQLRGGARHAGQLHALGDGADRREALYRTSRAASWFDERRRRTDRDPPWRRCARRRARGGPAGGETGGGERRIAGVAEGRESVSPTPAGADRGGRDNHAPRRIPP